MSKGESANMTTAFAILLIAHGLIDLRRGRPVRARV
jgi:hypothetical protein